MRPNTTPDTQQGKKGRIREGTRRNTRPFLPSSLTPPSFSKGAQGDREMVQYKYDPLPLTSPDTQEGLKKVQATKYDRLFRFSFPASSPPRSKDKGGQEKVHITKHDPLSPLSPSHSVVGPSSSPSADLSKETMKARGRYTQNTTPSPLTPCHLVGERYNRRDTTLSPFSSPLSYLSVT